MNWLREPDTEPLPGYRLIEPIGTGGFGEVWKCLAPGGIYKAIKFVYGNLNSLDGDDVRAVQEMKALERVKQVRHPFVLSIEQIQNIDGELVIVMELADRNLHDCLLEYQAMGRPGIPRDILLGFLDDAAVGLDHLIEKHGLQHLDVKPRNLFMVADRVKVADFGLVKTLERSSASGLMGGVTPIYAAPETFANKISKHSDQYSLAIVYVELLTGKRPFNGKNIRQLALQHMTEPPDLSMLPEADRPIVARALAKNPDERFPSCTAFIRALSGRSDAMGSSGHGGTTAADAAAWARGGRSTPDVDLAPAAARTPRPVEVVRPPDATAESEIDESHLLASTAPHQETGILRPTILIGIGSFGRRALQEIRCRLTDRVGDTARVPCFRFLYVDCDPEAVHKAVSAPPDVALTSDEVFQVPLQPVTQYRRRQLDQILEWLPREKLYSIPRNLSAAGSRALGRLAFCDNYLRFVTRLRRELQVATHPESMADSADQTGLPLRDNVPQVLVFASAAGGSGGMLLDLGYAVRRVLGRAATADAPVTAFVYVSAPADPNASEYELANVYAGITELNHYSDPDVTFTAGYGGPDGPRVEQRGLPFTATYLLAMPERTPAAFRDVIAHLAAYVTNELTTPLGRALERVRRQPPGFNHSPFRTFGTYGVWFPRGLLLRAAAQRVATRLLKNWRQEAAPVDLAPVSAVVSRLTADARLRPEEVRRQIEHEAVRGGEGGPAELVERWLTGLEAQIAAPGRRADAAAWARSAWDQARDLIGTRPFGEHDPTVRRSRLSKLLEEAVRRVADAWGNEFFMAVRPLEDLPGHRLAAVETALHRLAAWCGDAAEAADQVAAQIAVRVAQVRADVQSALSACQTGSGTFSFFGGRSGRSQRHFVDQLRAFAHVRVQEDLADATAKFYRALRGRLEAYLHELANCRSRLDQLVRTLENPLLRLPPSSDTPVSISEEALQQTLHPTNTFRVVLPGGERQFEESARRFARSLQPQDLDRLESALHKLVLEPRGGLIALCQMNADMTRTLFGPLVEQATAFLSDLLPQTDVTEVEASAAAARNLDLAGRIAEYHRRAAPVAGRPGADEQTLVLVPDSAPGRNYASLVQRTLAGVQTIPVADDPTGLLFCREHGYLTVDELLGLLANCRPFYQQSLANPHTAPHSRYDVAEWIPLGG